MMMRMSVSDAHLTSEGVRPSSLICDDTFGIPIARTVDIEGPILK